MLKKSQIRSIYLQNDVLHICSHQMPNYYTRIKQWQTKIDSDLFTDEWFSYDSF